MSRSPSASPPLRKLRYLFPAFSNSKSKRHAEPQSAARSDIDSTASPPPKIVATQDQDEASLPSPELNEPVTATDLLAVPPLPASPLDSPSTSEDEEGASEADESSEAQRQSRHKDPDRLRFLRSRHDSPSRARSAEVGVEGP